MRAFEGLLQSGIPLDWTTIRLGWQGLKANRPFDGLHVNPCLLTRAELFTYARAQIGYSFGAEADLVFDLAYCDELDNWTIQRCLDQLATADPKKVLRAERIWRWALLNEIVYDLGQQYETYFNQPSRQSWEQDEWVYEVAWQIERYWSDYGLPSEEIRFVQDWHELLGSEASDAETVLAKPREWLEEEKQRLMSDGSR